MLSTNYNINFHAQLLKNIINSSNEIVFAKDLNGIYRYANKIFCNEFNLTKDEIIGAVILLHRKNWKKKKKH